MDARTIANRILSRPLPRNPGPRDLANLLVEAAEAGYAACVPTESKRVAGNQYCHHRHRAEQLTALADPAGE